MASRPGLFYVYAKNERDDNSGRYLITFASRAVADEWWRAITSSVQRGYSQFSHVVRHSLQFYSYDLNTANIMLTITDNRVTNNTNFLNRVFFTLLNDRDGRIICPAPVLNYTDHRNNNDFYIRSMTQPEIFWYYDRLTERVRPSKTQRTRFNIRIVDREQRAGPNPIMIGSDKIIISATREEIGLGGERNQQLVGGDDPGYEFTFSDFDGGFEARFPPLIPGGSGEDLQRATITRTASNRGDRWELA